MNSPLYAVILKLFLHSSIDYLGLFSFELLLSSNVSLGHLLVTGVLLPYCAHVDMPHQTLQVLRVEHLGGGGFGRFLWSRNGLVVDDFDSLVISHVLPFLFGLDLEVLLFTAFHLSLILVT